MTLLEDEVSGVSPFTLADIGGGDGLRVQAYLDAGGNVVASQIRRVAPDNDIIRAPLQNKVDGSSVTVLGITFNTSGTTTFKLADDSVTNSATFYATVNVGDLIRIDDDVTANGTANAIKIE